MGASLEEAPHAAACRLVRGRGGGLAPDRGVDDQDVALVHLPLDDLGHAAVGEPHAERGRLRLPVTKQPDRSLVARRFALAATPLPAPAPAAARTGTAAAVALTLPLARSTAATARRPPDRAIAAGWRGLRLVGDRHAERREDLGRWPEAHGGVRGPQHVVLLCGDEGDVRGHP